MSNTPIDFDQLGKDITAYLGKDEVTIKADYSPNQYAIDFLASDGKGHYAKMSVSELTLKSVGSIKYLYHNICVELEKSLSMDKTDYTQTNKYFMNEPEVIKTKPKPMPYKPSPFANMEDVYMSIAHHSANGAKGGKGLAKPKFTELSTAAYEAVAKVTKPGEMEAFFALMKQADELKQKAMAIEAAKQSASTIVGAAMADLSKNPPSVLSPIEEYDFDLDDEYFDEPPED